MPRGETFGQHEPLTTRLANLVRSYPKGLSIFKEFIQNADDAEATEIRFILDERSFPTGSMPNQMHWLQKSPALLVFNNKPFTDADIEGIQKIGASGKSQSAGKTGRFGLGFNACYNLTDVPCFITRERIYLFDPHAATVPDATIDNPGSKYRLKALATDRWPLLNAFASVIDHPENTNDFNGTVFRLPFRSTNQAKTSKIKQEPYTTADFLAICDDLKRLGSAMLLFLKHITTLTVERYNDRGSTLIFSICTSNVTEVQLARRPINEILSLDSSENILQILEEKGDVVSSTIQEYIVGPTKSIERWRVINGFFANDDLMASCIKMIEHGQKAIPLSGAAWPLFNLRNNSGGLFCFLPIPMQTSLPIKLNGYFDLDDSRQNMFLDSSAKGVDQIRLDWNLNLLRTAAAEAYTQLLMALREDIGNEDAALYYRAFPQVQIDPNQWEHPLTSSVYYSFEDRPLLKTCQNDPWKSRGEVRNLPLELLSIRDSVVEEQLFAIPNPSLPEHVQDGLRLNDLAIIDLSPEDVRNALRVLKDINTPVDSAPRPILRDSQRIEALFKYCVKDGKYTNFKGLPLLIDSLGCIRTYDRTPKVLRIGDEMEREVFEDKGAWFLDSEFVQQIGVQPLLSLKILQMTDAEFFHELKNYYVELTKDGYASIRDLPRGPLSKSWLSLIYRRILSLKVYHLIINEIPLIPDQNGILKCMGSPSTPLLLKGSVRLRSVLSELSVPIVSQLDNSLIDILFEISEKHSCLWSVTARDLIDTLNDQCITALSEYTTLTNIQRVILDFLSKDDSIEMLKEVKDRIPLLKKLKLFPRRGGALITLDGYHSYIPSDYEFPAIDIDIVLLDDGPQRSWRRLYETLEISELSRAQFIRTILLPEYENLSPESQLKALVWLRDNLSVAQSEESEVTETIKLLNIVKSSELIKCTDGIIRAPADIYQPDSLLAKEILGEAAAFPDMNQVYNEERDRWQEFFQQISVPIEPRYSDIGDCVKQLSDDHDDQARARLRTIFGYFCKEIERVLEVDPEIPGELAQVLAELRDINWLPARQSGDKLICFTRPQDKCAKPPDVYFPRNSRLIASQASIGDFGGVKEPSKKVRGILQDTLGLLAEPPSDLVIAHFKSVLAAYETNPAIIKNAEFEKTLLECYRYFGGRSSGADEDEGEEPESGQIFIRLQLDEFRDIPCIWDKESQRFYKPGHVFETYVRYMNPWRVKVLSNNAGVERGYTALGRKHSPDVSDWKTVLHEIQESGADVTVYPNEGIVREIIQLIAESLSKTNESDSEVLVPTTNGNLEYSASVFIQDAEWLDDVLKDADIPILFRTIPKSPNIKQSLCLKSIAEEVCEELVCLPVLSTNTKLAAECMRLQDVITSEPFVSGICRVLRHEGHSAIVDDCAELQYIRILCVKDVRTNLAVFDNGDKELIGQWSPGYFIDQASYHIYLSETRHRYFADDIARLINRVLAPNSIRDLSPVTMMLSCEPDEISTVLTDLRIRTLEGDIELEEINESENEKPDLTDIEIDNPEDTETTDDENLETTASDKTENNGLTSNQKIREGDRGGTKDDATDHAMENDTSGPTETNTTSQQKHTSNDNKGDESTSSTGGNHRIPTQRSTKSIKSISTQKRLYSYVRHIAEQNDANDKESTPNRALIDLGKRAVEVVIQYETKHGRQAESMPHENPGYDVISRSNAETRYIEVKGTEGIWDATGVALTSVQFNFARHNPQLDFWLYVVENIASASPSVYEIRMPSELVDRFVFDGGWKQVAVNSTDIHDSDVSPEIGDEVFKNESTIGRITDIKIAGRIKLLVVTGDDGIVRRVHLSEVVIKKGHQE